MRIVEIIERKRDGKALTKAEIDFWIDGVTHKTIPDYQTSALLMAIVLKGMNLEETTYLTEAMVKSGDVIDLSNIDGIKVDKHSTGGVGDKTSMIISPIVASCGGKVAKMSGRGLGHTGGTLDKLESIDGYQVEIPNKQFIDQVNDINMALVGQTGNLVYADKVLYALRDVTGTVESLPLIAASIMSKKIAGGADAIVLDVKFGEGAFMKDVDAAKKLAETMINIGERLEKKITALLTNMNQPLGYHIGNALEVYEAVKTLKNEGPKDLEELCLVASGYMLLHGGVVSDFDTGYERAKASLEDGSALAKFKEWIHAQGGDTKFMDDLEGFIAAKHRVEVKADVSGYVNDLKALELGMTSLHLGAGRSTVEDDIDMKAGIILNKKVGDKVEAEDILGVLLSSEPITESHIKEFKDTFIISNTEVDKPKLIEFVL
ncbi:MAG TPA: pyrimidine-nucleoside phosphorylase [Erysipelothrix sp.]|nr:pyrimidine-nucleoside phosphorylase [Erysipelothrix sp.]